MRFHRRASLGLSAGLLSILLAAFLTPSIATSASAAEPTVSATINENVTTGENRFTYSGSWVNCGGCQPTSSYLNGFKYAYQTGSSVTLTFTGTQAKLYGIKELTGGIGSVSVDGGAAVDVSFYSATKAPALTYTTAVLGQGTHTLRLTATGRKGQGSSATILVDKAEILTGTTTSTTSTTSTTTATTTATTATTTSTTATTAPTPPVSSGSWLSGASGTAAGNGSFATWRGTALGIGGTWMDTGATAQVSGPYWAFTGTGTWAKWTGPMDVAVGAIFSGESWSSAAAGAYDGRWRESLSNLKSAWGSRNPSNLYIRFAHEFNGFWYPWSVTAGDVENFKTAWARFRALQREILPAANLVWCPNNDTQGAYDIRSAYPGAQNVDVISIDWYNNWPYADTVAEFQAKINEVSATGGPKGVEKWRQYAQSMGKPFAISEWASIATSGGGDAPVFYEQFRSWLQQNAGSGPGQVKYEVLFNIDGYGSRYDLYPSTLQPASAAKYRDLW